MCALCYTADHHCWKGPYWSYTHPRRGRCSVIYSSCLLFIKIKPVNLSFQPGFVRSCRKIKVAIAKGLYGLYLNLPWDLLWSSLKFFMISLRLSLCSTNMWKGETAVGKEQRGRNEKDQGCRKWNVNLISTVNSLKIGCFFPQQLCLTGDGLSELSLCYWALRPPQSCLFVTSVDSQPPWIWLSSFQFANAAARSAPPPTPPALQGYMLGKERSSPAVIEVH